MPDSQPTADGLQQELRGCGNQDVILPLLLSRIPGEDVLLMGVPEFLHQCLGVIACKDPEEPFLHGGFVRNSQYIVPHRRQSHLRQKPHQCRVLFQGEFQKIHGAVPGIQGAVKIVNVHNALPNQAFCQFLSIIANLAAKCNPMMPYPSSGSGGKKKSGPFR